MSLIIPAAFVTLFHHSLKSPLCLWELDILQHSIRKLETYEEIHIVVTRYVRCDGVYVREELKRLGWTKAELKRQR